MAAIASRRLAAVRSVPDTDRRRPSGSTFAPSERGKNSYQDPNSARCRSTTTGHHPDVVFNARGERANSHDWATIACGISDPPPRTEHLGALGERGRRHQQTLAGHRLGRSLPARHDGLDVENGDPADPYEKLPNRAGRHARGRSFWCRNLPGPPGPTRGLPGGTPGAVVLAALGTH